MSGPEIHRQIAGLIEVIENIIEAYDSIKNLRDLPEAFQEVSKRLPLVEQTLRDAKMPVKKLKSADDAIVMENVLHSCDEKTDKLLEVFRKIANKSKDKYDSSVYRAVVIKQDKQRVETLMGGILEDLAGLVAHRVFPAEVQKHVGPLKEAKEELAKVSPSLADSDLDEQPGAANQYGNNNHQYNNFGNGNLKKVDGNNYESKGDMNFGMIPPKKSAERKDA
jgi:hypothetical protein